MIMKKCVCVIAAAVLAVSAFAGCSAGAKGTTGAETNAAQTTGASGEAAENTASADNAGKKPGNEAETKTEAAEAEAAVWLSDEELEAAKGKHHVEIVVKDYGTIQAELDGDSAPVTVANFLKLAGAGFYDGLTFHRIISGFMIQGGDPLGIGMGGSDYEIKGEFASNGVENPLSHTRGAISMARSQVKDSASSQFFIVHEDSEFLDGDYACFGYVTEGIEVVDAICEATQVEDNNGTVARENQPVIEKVSVVD